MARSISVVIPTYNYGRFLAGAITSALEQTCTAKEIIVVDDGSTDETARVARGFGDVVTYISQDNLGVCAARNRAVSEASGDIIAFLDADDFWEPTKLAKQLQKFDMDERIGLVHCGMREFDSNTGRTIGIHLDGGEEGVADKLLLWEDPSINVSGSVVMVSRKAFDAVGGFDPRMKVGEDWDFCYRVARKFEVGFVPEPLVNYRSHDAAAHLNVREMERGMSLFYEKAFADPSVAHLRRRAYGNFHKVMAGSYYHSSEYQRFAHHSVRSIWLRPQNLMYFLKLPWRYYLRKEGYSSRPNTRA